MSNKSGFGVLWKTFFKQPQTLVRYNYIIYWILKVESYTQRVPDFGGRVFPIFGSEKDGFISKTISTYFDKKSSNQFDIRINVEVIPYIYLFYNFI